MKTAIREILQTVILALIIFAIASLLVRNYKILYSSMEPNLHEGQWVLANKVVYHLHPPRRGDIVILKHPDNPELSAIKRVIGMPGETVEVKEGTVFIDGETLEEPYQLGQSRRSSAPYEVPEDQYFVMGDNRGNSLDSRSWGAIGRRDIIGKAWVILWPARDWGFAPNYALAVGGE